ncbi:MAG TPA: hypothetical protein PLP73_01925, partial [Candidatus Absconditabacterales bacterium]|nr:hypothetical protein [Candidatus Absconditabacterales bacterium]
SFIIIVILHIIVAKNLFVKSNYLLIDISQLTSCSPARSSYGLHCNMNKAKVTISNEASHFD